MLDSIPVDHQEMGKEKISDIGYSVGPYTNKNINFVQKATDKKFLTWP